MKIHLKVWCGVVWLYQEMVACLHKYKVNYQEKLNEQVTQSIFKQKEQIKDLTDRSQRAED